MRHRLSLLALVALACCLLPASRDLPARAAASSCQFLLSPGAVPAFCDSFDNPAGTGNRSGDLDGAVWGASRVNQNTNPTQGTRDPWYLTTLDRCGTSVAAQPETDIQICNGHAVEALTDGGFFAMTALYPTQPFDFAGRTGTVAFDVSDDTQGVHAAWPEFWLTDQPVPAPHGLAQSVDTVPRNGYGFSLAQLGTFCPAGRVGVDSMTVVRAYVQAGLPFVQDGCVARAPDAGHLNHIEVQISQSAVTVWGTDAGATGPLVQLAHANAANLPLTRGLIWLEDVHYNAAKACEINPAGCVNQATHTFAWDNVGFDGPVLLGDLHLDANDNLGVVGTHMNLGWSAGSSAPLTLQIPGATTQALGAASAALLTLNINPWSALTTTYRLNGNAWHSVPWPFPDGQTFTWRTMALPVPLAELVPMTNTVDLKVSGANTTNTVANVDLILVGARDTSPATATPTDTATATSTQTVTGTDTPTATATDTPLPTATDTATPVPTDTATPADTSPATSTQTPLPTSTATATATACDTATSTATDTATQTPIDTATDSPTATDTATPTPSSWTVETLIRNPQGTAVSDVTSPFAG